MSKTEIKEKNVSDSSMKINIRRENDYIAKIFNDMANEYDDLKDPWYNYTFAEIERILQRNLQLPNNCKSKSIALDVGCGTGIQSLVLAQLGYHVEGIDIADDLIAIAKNKLHSAGHSDFNFQHADATKLPFENGIAEVINCCGPTLSFIPEWRQAISEMSRCLKSGGKLILEVEGKWTLDMLWEVFNALLFNCFGYDKTLREAIKQFLPPWKIGHNIVYSFVLESGEVVPMPLKLFTASELDRELEGLGLTVQKRWGLNFLTNLFPSTVLHHADAGRFVRTVFKGLATLERLVYSKWPFNALACSLIIIAKKKE
jgi:ubiquinone/menaquinone biosynthesis C-methylase UbiE